MRKISGEVKTGAGTKNRVDLAAGSPEKKGGRRKEHRRLLHGWNLRCMCCLLPSFAGIGIFFLLPYARVLYYSVISDQFRRNFVGLGNYMEIMGNTYFRLAMKNSLKLIAIGVPLLILMALLLSIVLAFALKRFPVLRDAFSICAVALFLFAETWNMVEQPMLYVNEDVMRTLSTMLGNAGNYHGEVLPPASVLFMVPVLLWYLLYHRELQEGLKR